jgi:hypothetical protein
MIDMDGFKIIVFFGGGFLLFILGIWFLGNYMDSKKCYASYSEYKPEYEALSGCRIEWHGKMTPVEIIRNINQ